MANWTAIESIGVCVGSLVTGTMAFLTYQSLQENRKQEKNKINREIIDKLCVPLLKGLNTLQALLELFYTNRFIYRENKWSWPTIDQSLLLYKLPLELINQIHDFDISLNEFITECDIQIPELEKLVWQEINILAEKVVESTTLVNIRNQGITNQRHEWRCFSSTEYPLKVETINIFELIFNKRKLEQSLKDITFNIKKEDCLIASILVERITRAQFEETLSKINKRIEETGLSKLIDTVYRLKAQRIPLLEQTLEDYIEKLRSS